MERIWWGGAGHFFAHFHSNVGHFPVKVGLQLHNPERKLFFWHSEPGQCSYIHVGGLVKYIYEHKTKFTLIFLTKVYASINNRYRNKLKRTKNVNLIKQNLTTTTSKDGMKITIKQFRNKSTKFTNMLH